MRWGLGLALGVSASVAFAEPALQFVRSVTLTSSFERFGGLSAIETENGQAFTLLSDRGQAFHLDWDRAAEPRLSSRAQPAPNRDSEGLAWANGTLYFSYEGPAQVKTEAGRTLPRDPAFRSFGSNAGFEALAGTADGTLYALPETSGDKTAPFPVFQFRAGTWRISRTVPRRGAFVPVGADFGPDGSLYLLERAFSPLGFRSRIRRFKPDDPDGAIETLWTSRLGQHDNLEGLTVWQSSTGATCLTMVSDDNFLRIQRTELVEYALTSPLAGENRCD